MRLPSGTVDGNLEVLTVVSHLASTGSVTSEGVLADHAGSIGRGTDIDGVVTATGAAPGGAGVSADESARVGASVQAAGALGTLGGELDALHVDLTGDIEAAVSSGAEGELEDGLVQETHVQVRVVEGSTAAAGEAISNRELLGLASSELDGDDGLVGVDPHGGLAPAPDHGVLVSAVGEGGRVLAVTTDPDLSVVGLGVDTELGSELRGEALDATENIAENTISVRGSGRRGGSRGRGLGGRGCVSSGGLSSGGGSDDLGLRGGRSLSGRSRSGGRGGGGTVAVVNLAPVDTAEVKGNVVPVDVLGVALYVVSLVEAGMAKVARGGGLADSEGAQHQGRLVTHVVDGDEYALQMCVVRSLDRGSAGRRDMCVRLQRVTGVNWWTAA